MLPSCGHFKNIPCPFYKFALCVRPHCPYKHHNAGLVLKYSTHLKLICSEVMLNWSTLYFASSLLEGDRQILNSDMLKFDLQSATVFKFKSDHATENFQRQVFTPLVEDTEVTYDSKADLNVFPNKSYDDVTEKPSSTTYIPTPVESNSKPPSILKQSSTAETAAISYVPEYKPTPISRLKECASTVPVKASKSVYTPEFPVLVRKKKNVEEYDPTEVKRSSTVQIIQLSSDDDLDDDDDGCAPQFSDDDFEEEKAPTIDSTKQVPEVIVVKEEPVEEEKIDEFSVVDKILVDCKKNEMFLNSFKKISSKTNDIVTTKNRKNDKNVTVQPEKQEIKKSKNNSIISSKIEKNVSGDKLRNSSISSTKTEKNVLNNKADSAGVNKNISSSKVEKNVPSNKLDNTSKLKNLKDEVLDLLNSPVKAKSTDSKKDHKNSKKEKTINKEKKISSSHSSHSKEKLKKDSKEIDKHSDVKKHSHTQKTNSSEDKNKKSSKHSNSDTSDKKEFKKKKENHTIKNNDISRSPSKKKRLHENENVPKTVQPHVIKLKEKKSSNDHSKKRKTSSDSDFEKHSSKSKSAKEDKRAKSEFGTFPSKKTKYSESHASEKSKSVISDKIENNNDTNSDNDSDYHNDDTALNLNDLLSSSESDPDEECRRIFEECYPENSEPPKQDKKEETFSVFHRPNSPDASDLVIMRRKRFAHPGAAEAKPPSKQPKLEAKRPLNPAQVMHNRFLESQARFAQLNDKEFNKGAEKKRLSFMPSKNLLDAVKSKTQSNSALENYNPLPPTVSKTYKATQRTAHIPEVAKKPRPLIPAEYGSKVPVNIRQRFLNSFIDNCLKFCSSEDEAYDMALEEEKKVYDRSSSRPLYLNVAANALQRLRRRAEEGPDTAGNSNVSSKNNSNQKTVSHQAVLNGPLAQRRSFSILGKKKEAPEIKGKAEFYEYLLEYVMTPEQLKENSYPLPHPTEEGRAVIEGAYANRTLYCNDAYKRICCRCRKTYYVNDDGDYVREEECDFHWGRLWKKRIAGNFESRYSCCQGDAESDGCCVSPGHVFEGSERHVLRGYTKTLPKSPPPDNCYGVYALDCEMCYTTAGMELTRITVVDTDLKTVYESFVKPANKVLDYNTRFSGITEDDIKHCKTALIDVQAVLLCIFSDKTILIGHSLESDFKALKLFHTTVVDTSVVFPHKSGLPYKRALKTLMAEKLNKIIQNDVGGHDSREDAVACMELMLWKVKEDMRGNR